jgi:hypothetical protein
MSAPDSEQLRVDPQLAMVAAADSLLDNLASALLAAHPDILADHHSNSPVVWLADALAAEGRRMQMLLHRYRTAVERDHADPGTPLPRLPPIV